MTITLPDFKPPTDEERRASSATWLATIKPCLYTYWPERYQQLSFPTHVEELTRGEFAQLAAVFDGKPDEPWTPQLQAKVKRGATQFTNGSFFRLESRSPKDNYWGEMTNFRACSYHDVKQLIWSERILDDLARYEHAQEPCRLLFREWHPIPKPQEFRCFIRGRKLAGISQYHYTGWDESLQENRPLWFRNIIAHKDELNAALKQFIEAQIIPHLHVEDLVADLWRDHTGKVTLIEINPYKLSDPCLFRYEDLETAEGEFRVVEQAP